MKIFLLLFFSIISLTACTKKYENLLKSNTAEVQKFMLVGENDNVKASLVCGLREKEYKINGYATELIEFGILTFDLKNIEDYDITLAQYVLNVGTLRYDGDLEKNPFNGTLVTDIKRIIDCNENIYVKLIIGDFSQDISLTLVGTDWKVDTNDVYKSLANNYKKEINAINSDNVFGGEVYIKIVNDSDIYKSDYYWYVSIVGRKGGTLSLIISPVTSDILAVNNTLEKVT